MSKPVHPAAIHFPIAFLTMAWVLDFIYIGTTSLKVPYLVAKFGSDIPTLAWAGHTMLCIGLISAVPATISGNQQLISTLKAGGMYGADGKTVRPKVATTFKHAILNYVAIFANVYSWYVRRDAVGYLPSGLNVAISGLTLPLTMAAANLGGQLTYNFGMGINLAKKGKTV